MTVTDSEPGALRTEERVYVPELLSRARPTLDGLISSAVGGTTDCIKRGGTRRSESRHVDT